MMLSPAQPSSSLRLSARSLGGVCCTTYSYEANQCESQLPMIDGAVGAINASWRLVGRAEEDRVSSGCHGLTRKNKKVSRHYLLKPSYSLSPGDKTTWQKTNNRLLLSSSVSSSFSLPQAFFYCEHPCYGVHPSSSSFSTPSLPPPHLLRS